MEAINPRTAPDPRFDPASDEENALAHEMMPADAEEDLRKRAQDMVHTAMELAWNYWEEELQPDAVSATDYYHGRKFGDEQTGRSQVVSTDVRDATLAQLPSILRIVFGPEKVVEFAPRTLDEEAEAEQQTDYINYLVTERNPGYLTFLSLLKDGLIRRLGIVKWWWDEDIRIKATEYTGLSLEDMLVLVSDPSVEVEITAQYVAEDMVTELYDARVIYGSEDHGHAAFAAIPPEEFFFTPDARDIESAPLVAHSRMVPADELIAKGIDPEMVENAKDDDRYVRGDDSLRDARLISGGEFTRYNTRSKVTARTDLDVDETQRPVLFTEAYARFDGDGDGIAELRRFDCVGTEYDVVNGDGLGEIVDFAPFACFTPDPEPHTIVGQSNWDLLKEVQRVKSQVLRRTLDSLAQSVHPAMEVDEQNVNMKDVLNPEVAGVYRVRKPGSIAIHKMPFVGGDTLPMLQYYDTAREDRTGTSRAAMGLDADALQSSTKAAVAATLSGAQARIEMIVRTFSELTLKPLYKGLRDLCIRYQDRESVIKLRGQYVAIDPRFWSAGLDVRVNTALGQGTPEDKVRALERLLAEQKELLMNGSPLVSMIELRNTYRRLSEMIGAGDSNQYFRPWGPEQEQQHQQMMAQQQPPPDPAMLLVEIEAQKVQLDAQEREAKLMLERQKLAMEDDFRRDKLARDTAVKVAAMENQPFAATEAAAGRDREAQDEQP